MVFFESFVRDYLPPIGGEDTEFLLIKLFVWTLLIAIVIFVAITRFLLIPRYAGRELPEKVEKIGFPLKTISSLKAESREIISVLNVEKQALSVGISAVEQVYKNGEISSDVYEEMKNTYTERIQELEEEIQKRLGVAEIRKLEEEFDKVRLGFMEPLETIAPGEEGEIAEISESEALIEGIEELSTIEEEVTPETTPSPPSEEEIPLIEEVIEPTEIKEEIIEEEKPEIEAPPAPIEAPEVEKAEEIPLEEEPIPISPLPELKEEPTVAEAEKTEKMFAKSTSIAELRSEMLKALKRLKGFMETE
ncbi:MAG: hypothetical protein Q6356_006765 [Candidatus Wukongarchaeota archaeon]|nr:hypothetical protein [Candidatus Wukongarchaeota archaeon]